MPRYQPPKDYYTATEVKKILNISNAMIAVYVEKGKLRHIIPKGRVHGFYPKKDVDRLANELNAFFSLNEAAPSQFMQANTKDITTVVAIVKALFTSPETESHVVPAERYISWMKKNPDIIYVLKLDDDVIGCIITLPLKSGSPKIQEILQTDLLGEVNITLDDIEEYKPGNHIELYIAAIGIDPLIEHSKQPLYGATLIGGFTSVITELGSKGVIINRFVAIGATKKGVRLLQNFGFSEIVPPKPGTRAFIIDTARSGTPAILQYKEALRETTKSELTEAKTTKRKDTTTLRQRKTTQTASEAAPYRS